ncbi:MAG: FtsW/RodA/SpoVE family cell cycle protein [Bdellovibrionales bacterium]|nr:FtsW/RodA/SpoVE family cell cycle protein [Bdellovibrionales bacterium]
MQQGRGVDAYRQSTFWQFVATGLTLLFGFQVLINFGVVVGLLPTKGLSMPFLSYGGSHLVMTGMLFGLLWNIQRSMQSRTI